MTKTDTKTQKLDKRAAALRENLKRRKLKIRDEKASRPESAKEKDT